MDENLAMFLMGCGIMILGASCLFLQEEVRELQEMVEWLETTTKTHSEEIKDIRFGRETKELWQREE